MFTFRYCSEVRLMVLAALLGILSLRNSVWYWIMT